MGKIPAIGLRTSCPSIQGGGRARFFVVLILSSVLLAEPKSSCPIMLIGGAKDQDTISVTFRNTRKLPIRRLEFNCRLASARANGVGQARCYEPNASFLPVGEYTVSYAIPGGSRGTVLVSVKSVTFSDGHVFKPTKRDPCTTLTIKTPRKVARKGSGG